MAWIVLAFDGVDEGAPARRAAARERHLTVIAAMAGDGRLALGVPLMEEDGRIVGSLMVLSGETQAGLDAYLAEEPFAREGVWARIDAMPGRIAPLPYRPLPSPGSPMPTMRTHTVIVAMDGTDEGAVARRMSVRPAHMARIAPCAARGELTLGCAVLDAPGGQMIGSVVVTPHATNAAARAFWNDDPYVTEGVWRDLRIWGTGIAPLPYRPLPGVAA
ncbi:YciI family protein [Elioraea sp.]|uniref:YciI family protein n=1 Tax=Elioraea sp. TaxID=2185103 RepID=UPI003F6FCBF5